ncbi:hypothetical protein [Lysinibacillus xylanilyticus]|uniref:hypothetical protein n=1 Tax=Lysinibacillus xylanilyticus TaxID=582475 RepID=UPI003D037C98
MVDWSGDWATPWGSANRGTKAKIITSCDNAFVTNIVLARDPGASIASEAAHRTPPGSSALRESEASAAKRPVGTEITPSFCRSTIQKGATLILGSSFQII